VVPYPPPTPTRTSKRPCAPRNGHYTVSHNMAV
jgi:hypothetical protein